MGIRSENEELDSLPLALRWKCKVPPSLLHKALRRKSCSSVLKDLIFLVLEPD